MVKIQSNEFTAEENEILSAGFSVARLFENRPWYHRFRGGTGYKYVINSLKNNGKRINSKALVDLANEVAKITK